MSVETPQEPVKLNQCTQSGPTVFNQNISKQNISVLHLYTWECMHFIFELSEHIFNRFSDKSEHVSYLLANRNVAMQQNNLFQFSLFFFLHIQPDFENVTAIWSFCVQQCFFRPKLSPKQPLQKQRMQPLLFSLHLLTSTSLFLFPSLV